MEGAATGAFQRGSPAGFFFARAILHRKPAAEIEAEDATALGWPPA